MLSFVPTSRGAVDAANHGAELINISRRFWLFGREWTFNVELVEFHLSMVTPPNDTYLASLCHLMMQRVGGKVRLLTTNDQLAVAKSL